MLPSHVHIPLVRIEEGEIQGKRKRENGDLFYAYMRIPYAKPPVGDLRFQPPVPIEKWDGVLETFSELGRVCLQFEKVPYPSIDENEYRLVGSEDCLYVNVFTLEDPRRVEKKKAVMVFIHGGLFHKGSGPMYEVSSLMKHDIILVTFNYRLHVLGFLNVGLPSCPGNVGLKDQLLALKWVKRNIHFFGGDPDNITLFGQGAGAVSVHLHTLSPLSKGLFHKVIIQSGHALSPWAVEKDPVFQARRLGRLLGYNGEDLEVLVQHLKNQSAEELCTAVSKLRAEDNQKWPACCANYVFIPSVEEIKEGAFLPELPKKLMESAAAIPALIGFNQFEGLLYFSDEGPPKNMTAVMTNPSLIVKHNFNLDADEQEELLAEMLSFYDDLRGQKYDRRLEEAIKVYGDMFFMKFYEAFDHLIRSNVPPFVYLFAHDGLRNMFKKRKLDRLYISYFRTVKEAAHADELGYLFHPGHREMHLADINMILQIGTLWTNFAKSGYSAFLQPQLDWRAFTHERPCYLKIGERFEVIVQKLGEKQFGFWEKWSARFFR